ncbi:D-lactaldehyde dehydrogenase [Clavulina sp. PMI_390]|nr:D-lactaldehyde dehydrogenase [Clavulina sp. PMI_390]
MPAVTTPGKILVTGASGALATHVVQTLLNQGYSVVGTVRSASKGDYLVDLFKSEAFSYAIVKDIGAADAFDDVIRTGEFDGVLHTASPFHTGPGDPQAVILPAVKGTTNVLESVMNFGPTVKRVVITASAINILEPKPLPYTFSEKDWNTSSISAVEQAGDKADGYSTYCASKTLAERAAWDFMSAHRGDGSITFDLVATNPSYIFGPILHDVQSPETLNESHKLFFDTVTAKDSQLTPEKAAKYLGGMVDARTVALAHVRALSVEEAGGNRFFVTDSQWSAQDACEWLFDPFDQLFRDSSTLLSSTPRWLRYSR